MSETGSVKFNCQQLAADWKDFNGFAELNEYRRKLFELGLIGVDATGIGFGNVSIRSGASPQFYITGSGTGKLPHLTPSHYAKVTAYDFDKNWVRCEGSMVASAESLTHAAVYESSPDTMAIIHCHDLNLWMAQRNRLPTTPGSIEYGSPEMARAVQRLFATTNVGEQKLFVMAAHESGIVAFGKDLSEALGILSHWRNG